MHAYAPCNAHPPYLTSAGMLIHESLTGNPVFPIGEQL